MKRFFSLVFVLAAAFFLAGCESNPVIPEAKAATPVMPTGQPAKSALEMEYEIRKMELELETTREMAMIKFAAESKSEFARGMATGMMAKRQDAQTSPRRSNVVEAALAEKRQSDAVEIRKMEIAAQNSTFNKAMRVVEVGKDLLTFKWGINYRLDDKRLNNEQERYRLDNYRGLQQDAYNFSSQVVNKGPYFFSLPAGSQQVETQEPQE